MQNTIASLKTSKTPPSNTKIGKDIEDTKYPILKLTI